MQNIARTKKNTGLAKPSKAARSSWIPSSGCSRTTSSPVTPIGSASVAHRRIAVTKTAASRCPSGVSPSGVGASATARPAATAARSALGEPPAPARVSIAPASLAAGGRAPWGMESDPVST